MTRIQKFNSIIFTIFLIFSLFVFRIREYGSDELDFQIFLRLIAWLVGLGLPIFYFSKFKFRFTGHHERLLVGFFSLAIIMLPLSLVPTRSLIVILSYISFYSYFKYVHSRFGESVLLKFIVYAFFVVTVASYGYYFFIPDLGRHIYWLNDVLYVSPRMSGVFSTSNAMGGFSAIYCLIIVYCLRNNFLNRHLLMFFLLLSVLALFLSNSKTAISACVLSSLFLYSNSRTKSFLITCSLIGILTIFSYALLDFYGLMAIISRHGDPNEVLTFTGRTHIWPAVFEMAMEKPISGYGIGVTSIAIPTLADTIGYTPAHAHNLVLQAFFSLGFGGMLLILAIVVFNVFVKSQSKLSNAMAMYIFVTSLFEASFLSGIAGYSIVPLILMVLSKNVDSTDVNGEK